MCKEIIQLERGCPYTLSGVNRLWVAEFDETLDWSIVNEELIINTVLDFKELQLEKDSGSLLTETSLTLNGYISKSTVTSSYGKAKAASLRALNRLLNKKMYALVLDNNGLYWFLGIEAGVKTFSITTQTDVLRGFSGHNLILVSTSSNPYNSASVVVGGEFNNDFNLDFNG